MASIEDHRPAGGPGTGGGSPEPEGTGAGDLEFDEAWAGARGVDDTATEPPSGDERPVFEDPNDR